MDKTKLTRYMATTAYTPAMSMDKNGKFTLNAAAAEHFKLTGFKFVSLFHTTEMGGAVVLEFTNEPGVGVFKLCRDGKNTVTYFTSKGYMERFKVPSFQRKRVVPEPDSKYIYVVYGG